MALGIHERFSMCKVSARWVPRILSVYDRHLRVASSRELLQLYETILFSILSRLVMGDKF